MKASVGVCVVALTAMVFSAAAQQTLTTDREAVTFNHHEQTASVQVLRAGRPVQINRVTGYRFLVGDHNYSHMISVRPEDGRLRVTPTYQLEVGTYLLSVDTNAGRINLTVNAPLAQLEDSLEARAARAGVSKHEMMQMLGLSTPDPRERMRLSLPATYYEGQTLVVDMPARPGRHYTWLVNDQVVKEGHGKSELEYTFRQPGDYVVELIERENGIVIASAGDVTRVLSLPTRTVEVRAGTEFVATAPEGYRRYAWVSNGRDIGNGRQMRYYVPAPGEYDLEVISEDPVSGPRDQFSRARYHIVAR